jgi:hypothetical protein
MVLPYPTPLILAIYLGRTDVVTCLLDHEVDPNGQHPPTRVPFLLTGFHFILPRTSMMSE